MTQALSDAPVPTPCDVLVIGGGPAGSTIAALLAQQGRDVVLLEKDHHPRFHIGESLLPCNVQLFERLGLREKVDAIGMVKHGIEFISECQQHRSLLTFDEALECKSPTAWQVRRSELDQILFSNAGERGAHTFEGCQVRKVDFDADGATVQAVLDAGARKQWRARYVVDASGRDTLLANQFGDKHKNPRHNSAAIFGHFTNAQRLQGPTLEGHISIFWFPHGWFWFIPLADGSTSVGAVCWPYYLKSRNKPLREFFDDTIAMAPGLAARLKDAQLVDEKVHATGNYSYSSGQASGERWIRVGDAFTFIDPVFSSGVYMAMSNAFQGVEVVSAALDEPKRLPAARKRYEAHAKRGPREFSWFIFRMTNPAMRALFLHPGNVARSREAVLSVLAGDVYGEADSRRPLNVFKFIYYLVAFKLLPQTLAAWRARRHNIREVGAVPGENIMQAPR